MPVLIQKRKEKNGMKTFHPKNIQLYSKCVSEKTYLCSSCIIVRLWSNFSGQNTQQVIALLKFMCYKWHFQLSRGTHEVEHKHVDDNKDTIEDDVH